MGSQEAERRKSDKTWTWTNPHLHLIRKGLCHQVQDKCYPNVTDLILYLRFDWLSAIPYLFDVREPDRNEIHAAN